MDELTRAQIARRAAAQRLTTTDESVVTDRNCPDARSDTGSTIVISINALGATRTLSTITPALATTTTTAVVVTPTTTAAGVNVPAAVPGVVQTSIDSSATFYTAAGVIICAPMRRGRSS